MPFSSFGDQARNRGQAGLVRAGVVQRDPELLGSKDDDRSHRYVSEAQQEDWGVCNVLAFFLNWS